VVIVDEVGPLELRGRGWSQRLSELLLEPGSILIVAVRENLTEAVIERFNIKNVRIIGIGNADTVGFAVEIAALIVKRFKNE
jgi:nucleoside-triphosphatase THEP1